MLNRNVAIDCASLPNRRVECGSLLGWSFSKHGLGPVNLGHNFSGRFHKIMIVPAVLRSDLCFWLCRDSLPLYLEADLILGSQEIPMPVQGCTQYSHHHRCEPTGRMPSSTTKTLEGRELHGGIAVMYVTRTSLGGHE